MGREEGFVRWLPNELVNELNELEGKPDSWWHKLVNRPERDVFFAVRGGYLSVYTNGGSLMKVRYTGGRLHVGIHEEYLLLRSASPYVDLCREAANHRLAIIDTPTKLVENFKAVQHRIKVFQGDERCGVATIASQVDCVIDIEITDEQVVVDSLLPEGEETSRGAIDFAAVDPTGDLCFYEAKLLTNSELRSSLGPPAIIGQLKNYQQWVGEQAEVILEGFRNVAAVFAQLQGEFFRRRRQAVPKILSIRSQPTLIIFGFNNVQLEHEVPEVVKRLEEHGIDPKGVIKIGSPKNIKTSSLFRVLPEVPRRFVEKELRSLPVVSQGGALSRLKETARRNGCLELFDEAIQLLVGSLLVWQPKNSKATMPFARKKADPAMFCLYPGRSNKEKGLAVGMWPSRLREIYGVEEDRLHQSIRGLTKELHPKWKDCLVVWFKDIEGFRKLLCLINP